jgi:IS605 OrfB family transposase
MANEVNRVWNFCNETQIKTVQNHHKWFSAYDFHKLTGGSSKYLNINSTTVQRICEEYAQKIRQFKKWKLNWRSYKKQLPWIPFKTSGISIDREAGTARYYGLDFSFWNSRPIIGEIKTGSINADSRGRFYLNLTCKIPNLEVPSEQLYFEPIGIDLGLHDVATLSNGIKYESNRYTRAYATKLAKAQRAGKKKQVKNIHKKISNSRKDSNHKVSTEIVNRTSEIYVGDVSSSELAKTKLAKSVHDVGWHQLKSFLKYKALARGITYREVNEAYSTQMCSNCFRIPTSSPKGIKDLSIRKWTCSICLSKHDRDINAARNIFRFGHESPPKQSSIRT